MNRRFLSNYICFSGLLFILIGCQLLRPYTPPLTPTPFQWKNRSNDSNEQSNLPSAWKSNDMIESTSNSYSDVTEMERSPEQEQALNQTQTANVSEFENEVLEPCALQEPSYEDVRRDLFDWWEVFNDPILNQLEEQALESSYTLWAALERVIEARAQARINFAPLLPAIGFAPSFSRIGSLFQNPFPDLGGTSGSTNLSSSGISSLSGGGGGAANATSSITNLPSSFRFVQSQYLVPLNLTYEIDLWSRLNNTYYAALIRAQAASQAYLSVLLSLTSDVATAYFQIRNLDTQQEVIQKNIHIRVEALDISQARYNAGLVTYLDVSRAQVEVERARSDSDDVRRLRGIQENLLATLVGVPASVFSLEYQPLNTIPPEIPTGLPSELLCRRPDIAEAERNLAAAYRDIGVAYANFFPSLNLNASYGFETPFPHLLYSWNSRFWEIGFNVFQTVFDAGRNVANYDYYKAKFSEAMANYQQQVLKGFQDVEDALVNLREYARQAKDIGAAVKAAKTTLELAKLRYLRGLVNYLDVVDAERQLLETEQTAATVLGNRYISTVMLVRALGGGWGDACDCDSE